MSEDTVLNHFFPKWQQLRTGLDLDGGWVLRLNLREILKKTKHAAGTNCRNTTVVQMCFEV